MSFDVACKGVSANGSNPVESFQPSRNHEIKPFRFGFVPLDFVIYNIQSLACLAARNVQ